MNNQLRQEDGIRRWYRENFRNKSVLGVVLSVILMFFSAIISSELLSVISYFAVLGSGTLMFYIDINYPSWKAYHWEVHAYAKNHGSSLKEARKNIENSRYVKIMTSLI